MNVTSLAVSVLASYFCYRVSAWWNSPGSAWSESQAAISVLGKQLERCGPEQLNVVPCPECPTCQCQDPLPFAVLAGIIGAIGGIALGFSWSLWLSFFGSRQQGVTSSSTAVCRHAFAGTPASEHSAITDERAWAPPAGSTSRILRRRD